MRLAQLLKRRGEREGERQGEEIRPPNPKMHAAQTVVAGEGGACSLSEEGGVIKHPCVGSTDSREVGEGEVGAVIEEVQTRVEANLRMKTFQL